MHTEPERFGQRLLGGEARRQKSDATWRGTRGASMVALQFIGTENLLRETFGPKFDEYASRVPAVFPRLF